MKLVDFLGLHMKSDAVLDMLETFDMRVIYQFDRTHENMADYYDAAAKENGFEIRFDENQVLTTVFCYVQPEGDIAAVDSDFIGVPLLECLAIARAHASSKGIKITEPPPASESFAKWIRLEHPHRWDHYQFPDGQLARVSMFLPNAGFRTRVSGLEAPAKSHEIHIHSYFSRPTDLSAVMRAWPEFKSGKGYSVDLYSDGANEAVSVSLIEDEANSYVSIKSNSGGGLFFRVIGAAIDALGADSDTLTVDRAE